MKRAFSLVVLGALAVACATEAPDEATGTASAAVTKAPPADPPFPPPNAQYCHVAVGWTCTATSKGVDPDLAAIGCGETLQYVTSATSPLGGHGIDELIALCHDTPTLRSSPLIGEVWDDFGCSPCLPYPPAGQVYVTPTKQIPPNCPDGCKGRVGNF